MNNREFRSDVQEIWLNKFAESSRVKKAMPADIVTPRDMIKLTAKFAAYSALAMGAVALGMMVAL